MAKQSIDVKGHQIGVKTVNGSDFLSITDMVKADRPNQRTDDVIRSWLRNSATVRFLEVWEVNNNQDFKPDQMDGIKIALGDDREQVSTKQFIEETGAIGIQSSAGRYGGTFCHVDIAFEFASWLSPEFKYFIIRDYQRIKSLESPQWDASRFVASRNYLLQTESIKDYLLPKLKGDGLVFAQEADLINYAVFGMTAKQFREQHPESKGNQRDNATEKELNVLANLESHNASMIRRGMSQQIRLDRLIAIAQYELDTFSKDRRLKGDG